MKGQILDFSLQNSSGLITGEDGKRYAFKSIEWKEQSAPVRGMAVDFDVDELGNAVGVYRALGAAKANSVSVALNNAAQKHNENGQLSLFAFFMDTLTKRYAQFSGRATRREYWSFHLFSTIIILGLQIFANIGAEMSEALGGLILIAWAVASIGFCVPQIAAGVRRLHDINKSGWWLLIAFIPIVGFIWIIVLLCQPTVPESSQYGDIA